MSICARCGFQSVYGFEACPNCRDPVTTVIDEIDDDETPVKLSQWEADPVDGCMTRTPFDAISEKGMPYGASMLLSGPAGCGKSSWALRIAAAWEGQAWYIPYERGIDALRRDAERLGVDMDRIWVCSPVASPFKFFGPQGLLIIDSLNDYASRYDGLIEGVRRLTAHAYATGTAVLMLAHVTKEWEVAGPERLKHEVDVHVEIVPGVRISGLRERNPQADPAQEISCSQKNRFGPMWRVITEPPWQIV